MTVNSSPPDSFLSSSVQMEPWAEQSVVAFRAMVMSALELGSPSKCEDQPDDRVGAVQVTKPGYRCRCGYEWVPRVYKADERPRVCPDCKSPNWDKPYRWHRKKKE